MCSLSTTHCDNKVMGEKPVTTRTRRWRCGGRRASDVGVKRVETYFVPSRPSWESDIAIKEEIRATLIADPALISGRVDIAFCGSCRAHRRGRLARECREIYFRRAFGERRLLRDVIHPNNVGDCRSPELFRISFRTAYAACCRSHPTRLS